jgi:EmrB/QacA subfamily drug resistance transporter
MLEQIFTRRWIALVVVCLGQLMIVLDTTIVNVALPAIREDLGFTQSGLAWVVDAYLIAFGSLLLLAGRLGDLFGRRRVFLGGLVVFTLASIACGLADSEALLIAARFVQGVGAAAASAVVVAIIATQFPRPAERATAMSVYTFVVAGGGSLGLLAGGLLTQGLDWHWIFFVNVPIGLIAFVLGSRLIEENEGIGVGGGVDWLGSVMVTAAAMTVIYALVGIGEHGWGSPHTLGFGALGLALLGAFGTYEARIASPILPPALMRLPSLAHANAIRALFVVGVWSTFFLGTLFLERTKGFSEVDIGLAFLPQTLMVTAMSLGVSARLVRRTGPQPAVVTGLVLSVAGLLVFATAGASTPYFPTIFAAFVLLGTGGGLSFMPLVVMGMADVPDRDAGLASALISVSTQIAAAVGVATLGSVASSGGFQLAFFVAAASVAGALAVALRGPAAEREPAAEVVRP